MDGVCGWRGQTLRNLTDNRHHQQPHAQAKGAELLQVQPLLFPHPNLPPSHNGSHRSHSAEETQLWDQHHLTGDGLCTAGCTGSTEKASPACSPGLQLLGLERFVHFEMLSSVHWRCCCWHTEVSEEQMETDTPHLCTGTGHRASSTLGCSKPPSSITNTNVPAGSCSEPDPLRGSLRAVLSSFQPQSHKSAATERWEEAREELKTGAPLQPHSS